MGLFKPFWATEDDHDIYKVLVKIDEIGDPKLLKKIALNASLSDVRERAVLNIDDQQTLFSVLNESDHDEVRVVALSKIVAKDGSFDIAPYNVLVDSFVKRFSYSKAHLAAINLSRDLASV